MATKDFIGYPQLMDKALRGVIRQALTHAAKGGTMGYHHFLISFDTNAPGVQLSDVQREKFPVEMTIVLQNQYWDLKVHEDAFEVGLSFQKMPETLIIPYAAITQFVDPSQNFGFKLQALTQPAKNGALRVREEAPPPAEAPVAETKPAPEPTPAEPPGTIVSLDKFRKK
jgi:hypothetical protein